MVTTPKKAAGEAIADAFIDTIAEGLRACDEMTNGREARHRIGVLAEITRGARKTIEAAGLRQKMRDHMGAAIREGRAVSARTKRICTECDDLYDHEPPDTTEQTCAFCTAEAAHEEDDDE